MKDYHCQNRVEFRKKVKVKGVQREGEKYIFDLFGKKMQIILDYYCLKLLA